MSDSPILIVEENAAQLAVLLPMVGGTSYPVRCAMTGSYALETLRTSTPVLVICDSVLSDMSSSQIVRHIRQDERLSDTKLIIIAEASGNVPDSELADCILIKPIRKLDLLKAIGAMLEG